MFRKVLKNDEFIFLSFENEHSESFESQEKGYKNNTLQFYQKDHRFEILEKFIDGDLKEKLFIKLYLSYDEERFLISEIKDVTCYGNFYLITWKYLEKY